MANEITNEELFIVKKMIEGDMDSFEYFFNKYYADLCNFVHVYLHDQVLSEEIVQDIFVYFWENKQKIQINTSVKSYLFSASKFRSLNMIRNARNQHRITDEMAKTEVFLADPDESYLDVNELKKILDAAVEQLAPKCREIFLLSKMEELSNREIAERLDISVKTVENQMTIALRKIRDYLAPFKGRIFILFLFHWLS